MDKEFDFSTAKRASEVPALQKLRQAHQRSEANAHPVALAEFFDVDVVEAIQKHNNIKDRQRANTVLRALFATA